MRALDQEVQPKRMRMPDLPRRLGGCFNENILLHGYSFTLGDIFSNIVQHY
jgi:hypothetical protein